MPSEALQFTNPRTPYPEFAEKRAALKTQQKDFLENAANEQERKIAERALRYLHSGIRTCDWYTHDPRDEADFLAVALISDNKAFINDAREHLRRCYESNEGSGCSLKQATERTKEHEADIKITIKMLLEKSDRLLELEELKDLKAFTDRSTLIGDMKGELGSSVDSKTMEFIGEGIGEAADPKFAERVAARKHIQAKMEL